MRLYQAGIYTSNFDTQGTAYRKLSPMEKMQRDSAEWTLESYHYVNKQSAVKKMRQDGIKIFLDSGAFSAFSLGATIDLNKYCNYIKENSDLIEVASVLDGIGDHKLTWENQNAMEKQGVSPLPCWHYGEPDAVGEYYVNNYPHITIGGLVPVSTPKMIMWLDRVFRDVLCHPDGTPKVKIHLFGMTSLPLMIRYGMVYSVDSSVWVMWAMNGMILLPRTGKQCNISAKSSARKVAGQHFDNYNDLEQGAIRDQIEALGGDIERLRNEYVARWAWNIMAFPYYARLNVSLDKFKVQQETLF